MFNLFVKKMNIDLTICVINVYFGKLSNYLELWIKSCEYNPTIDFLFVTDQKISYQLPPNIKYFPYTLQQMQQKATEILGFTAVLNKPYKCCDYRPIYGHIFSEQLKNYDYWGHCDMDMLFGDIRYFINKYELEKYDKFLALGHLSLYRNTQEVNERYKLDGAYLKMRNITYKEVYSNEKNYIFDELPGIFTIYEKNKFPIFTKRIFADIASVYTRYRIIESYMLDLTPVIDYKYQIFYWEKGKVFRAYLYLGQLYKEEYIYIHFKKRPNFNFDFDAKSIKSFYITHTGFHAKLYNVNLQDIKRFSPYNFMQEKIEMLNFFFYKQIQNIKKLIHLLIKMCFL